MPFYRSPSADGGPTATCPHVATSKRIPEASSQGVDSVLGTSPLPLIARVDHFHLRKPVSGARLLPGRRRSPRPWNSLMPYPGNTATWWSAPQNSSQSPSRFADVQCSVSVVVVRQYADG